MKPIHAFPLVLALCTVAQAAVQTQVFDLSQTFYDGPVAGSGTFDIAPVSLTVQPFDSGLGTLDSVEITWTVTMSGFATNLADSSGSISYGFGGSFYIEGISYNGFGNGGGGGAPAGSSYGDSATSTATNTFLPTETTANRIANWSTLSGPAAFNLSAYSSTDAYFGEYKFFGALADAAIAFDPDSSVTVSYIYTAIPEPGSAALLFGLGATGAMLMRRRRPASASAQV